MKLNLGSKETKIPGFTNVDIYGNPNVDIVADISQIPLEDNSIEEIYASHCLEHFKRHKTESVLREWYRLLEPNGTLYLAVPDFHGIVEYYNRTGFLNEMVLDMIYGIRDEKYNFHYTIFNYSNLLHTLSKIGFEDVEKVEYFRFHLKDCSTISDNLLKIPLSLNVVAKKGGI